MRSATPYASTALLACLLLGCAEPEIGWRLPPDMLPEERAAFGESCERWSSVAVIPQSIDDDGAHRVEMRLPQNMANGPHTRAEYSEEERLMRISRGLPRVPLLGAILHEQGHALGLQHQTADVGVMSPKAKDAIEFSEGDLAECRRVKACR